ncbi:MAG: DUF3326 domain-containing protein, partial [Candidatus Gastranaerophilaceae bacterium]
VHPKAAAEYITPTFLPCLLLGLQNAPLFTKGICDNFVTINDVNALIMPYNALGSSIVTNSLKRGIIVLAVEENKSVLNVETFKTGLNNDIIILKSYSDCLQFLRRV